MTSCIAFLFIISLIVVAHEFGHFAAARWFGVHVEVASFGFGPRVLTWQRNGTAYCISAFPLGGYVKMTGEGSRWQRCFILAAGPAMNLVLATVMIALVAFSGNYSHMVGSAVRSAGLFESVRVGISWTGEAGAALLQAVHALVVGSVSPRQLTGPVGIAQLAGEATRHGWNAVFAITALLSVNIGVFNLLPIPVLDGGHITIVGMEAVTGRHLTGRARRIVMSAGATLLLILIVFVLFNDLSRLDSLKHLLGA